MVPTLDELQLMSVMRIHEMLTEQEVRLAGALQHWQTERQAMLHQTRRLHWQIQAMGDELHHMRERWGDGNDKR